MITKPRTVPCAHCGGKGTIELAAEVTTVETYYFGCWRSIGHHLWNPKLADRSGLQHYDVEKKIPKAIAQRIDPCFCPGYDGPHKRDRAEVEGEAALHHVDGWTVLAWWDRSVDSRGACNSAIISKGLYDFTTMLEIGKAQMPHVMERQRVPIVLVVDKAEFYEA